MIPLHWRDDSDGLLFGDEDDLVGELPNVGDSGEDVGEQPEKFDDGVLMLLLYCRVVISYEHFDKCRS